MKKLLCVALLSASMISTASATPGVFIGVAYNFGGTVAVSLKALSTKREDRFAVVAGVNYFPKTERVSFDAGAGYVFKDGATTLTWDFTHQEVQAGLGYVPSTKE